MLPCILVNKDFHILRVGLGRVRKKTRVQRRVVALRLQNSFAEIAKLFTDFFRDLDVVPSDILSGLVLLRRHQKLHRKCVVAQVKPLVYVLPFRVCVCVGVCVCVCVCETNISCSLSLRT